MYDTAAANEEECVVLCQTAGHIVPEPLSRKRPSPGGVRQHLEVLGGLRCIVVEREEEASPLELVCVLAHGIDVLNDDLYGLADYMVVDGIRIILPEGIEESNQPREPEPVSTVGNMIETNEEDKEEWRRPFRQWWLPRKGAEAGVAEAGTAFANCAAEALAHVPQAKLVLGGFSQGAGVALASAVLAIKTLGVQPAGLLLMAPPPSAVKLQGGALSGSRVFVAGGDADEITPASGSEALLAECGKAGAQTEEFLKYAGGHEVTVEVAQASAKFLSSVQKS